MLTRPLESWAERKEPEMFTENEYQAEIAYRSNRIRNGVTHHRPRRTRVPFVRRPAETGTAR